MRSYFEPAFVSVEIAMLRMQENVILSARLSRGRVLQSSYDLKIVQKSESGRIEKFSTEEDFSVCAQNLNPL